MAKYYELTPAYGRNYKTAQEVFYAFVQGKDFEGDFQLGFALCSERNLRAPENEILLRFNRGESVAVARRGETAGKSFWQLLEFEDDGTSISGEIVYDGDKPWASEPKPGSGPITEANPILFTSEQLSGMSDDMPGACVACGHQQDGCEPDARDYECEACGANKVFGAQELLMMGLVEVFVD